MYMYANTLYYIIFVTPDVYVDLIPSLQIYLSLQIYV